jgi:hypothetical protein
MSEMQQQQEPVSITMNDIATALQVIDVVSRRGAFQGNELRGVGMLRDKLEIYLQQNAPQQADQVAQQTAEQPVDVAEPPQGELANLVVQ